MCVQGTHNNLIPIYTNVYFVIKYHITMRLHNHADLIRLSQFTVLVHIVTCTVKTTQLYFNSNNCDESQRRVTEDKSYVLNWSGKIDPKPCSFNFTAGEDQKSYLKYKICFRSEHFELTAAGVAIGITDNTNTWTYNKYDSAIDEICRDKVDDLGIWLEIDKDFKYVQSTKPEVTPLMIKVRIAAEKLPKVKESTGLWDTIKRTFQGMLPFIIIAVVVMMICTNKTGRKRSLELSRGLAQCICGKQQQTETTPDPQASMSLTNDDMVQSRDPITETVTVDDTYPPPPPDGAIPYPTDTQEYSPPPSYDDITCPEKKDSGTHS